MSVKHALLALLCVAVCLTLAGVGVLITEGVDNLAGSFRGDVKLVVFLDPDVSAEQRAAIEESLEANPEAEKAQLAYANAIAGWGEAGGYDAEVLFDVVAVAILGKPWEEVRHRPAVSAATAGETRWGEARAAWARREENGAGGGRRSH